MFSFYFFFYLAALIASLIYYKKYVDTPLRYFPLLIAYTLFNEILGYFVFHYEEYSFFKELKYHWHNVIIYNIYHLFFLGYIFWLYVKLVRNPFHKQLINGLIILTFLSYGVSLFFQDPFHSNLFYADVVGCITMILAIALHFRELKKTSGGINRFNIMSWFGAGLLLFNCYFPFYILNGYLNAEFFITYQLRQILWVVVSVMYTLFIMGFVFSKRSAFR